MAASLQENDPSQVTSPMGVAPFVADPDETRVVRASYRIVGVLTTATGVLVIVPVVVDSLSGVLSWRLLNAIGAAAALIAGIVLLTQRYSASPETLRRSPGIQGIAVGVLCLTFSLQGLLGGTTDRPGGLRLLDMTLLGMGFLVLGFSAVLLWSRRYAVWFERRWKTRESRRREKSSLPR